MVDSNRAACSLQHRHRQLAEQERALAMLRKSEAPPGRPASRSWLVTSFGEFRHGRLGAFGIIEKLVCPVIRGGVFDLG